jgi:cell division cycle protein 20 (cofactor of APC complex)
MYSNASQNISTTANIFSENFASVSSVSGNVNYGFESAVSGAQFNVRVVASKQKPQVPVQDFKYKCKMAYESSNVASVAAKFAARSYPATCERTLDAPGLLDDFYTNTLDWSAQNQIAVAFGSDAWIWDHANASASQLCADRESPITAVSWMQDGSHVALAVGGSIELWNVASSTRVRTFRGRNANITSLAWNDNVLSAGAYDGNIFHHDVRAREHHFATLSGHEGVVCSLKWNLEGTRLASGGNDNTCRVWDATSTGASRFVFSESSAAVKALAWCPWQENVLATGGGSADRCIRTYNTELGGAPLVEVKTDSQVTGLAWAAAEKEIVASHNSGKITVWRAPSFVQVAELGDAEAPRALHLVASPDGTSVCVAGGERLAFWRLWESAEAKIQRRRAEQETAKKALENPLR